MSVTPTIQQLRKDIESAQADLTRVEAQQEGQETELTGRKDEVRELGFDPDENLHTVAGQIMEDVHAAVAGVQKEVETVVGRTASS
jgi:hypothetical protein